MTREELVRMAQYCDLGRVCGPLDSLLDHEWEDLHRFAEFVTEAEREACALVCEAQRDLREEARALLRVVDALKEADEDTTLRALRHESGVRLYNSGLDKAAAAIRARSSAKASEPRSVQRAPKTGGT